MKLALQSEGINKPWIMYDHYLVDSKWYFKPNSLLYLIPSYWNVLELQD